MAGGGRGCRPSGRSAERVRNFVTWMEFMGKVVEYAFHLERGRVEARRAVEE